jgi:hypothetical protein
MMRVVLPDEQMSTMWPVPYDNLLYNRRAIFAKEIAHESCDHDIHNC